MSFINLFNAWINTANDLQKFWFGGIFSQRKKYSSIEEGLDDVLQRFDTEDKERLAETLKGIIEQFVDDISEYEHDDMSMIRPSIDFVACMNDILERNLSVEECRKLEILDYALGGSIQAS